MMRLDIPKRAAMIATIGPFSSDDRSESSRPTFLSLILFADMDRDSLVGVMLLFQLRFCPTAAPLFKPALAVAYAGPLSFCCPA